MGALSSFPAAWKLALTRHALLLPALIYTILSLPQMLLQLFYSGTSAGVVAVSVAYSLLLWLLTPFFTGGLLATAAEALRSEVSVSSFLSNAKKRYIYLLLASIIYLILIVVGVVVLIIIGVIFALAAKALFSPDFALASALIFILLGFLLLGAVLIMLNFYDVGVAIDGLDPIKTFKNSFNFVKSHAISVLGFLLLSAFTMLLLYIPMALVFFYHALSTIPELSVAELEAGTLPAPSFGLGVVLILILIITNTIATCFMYTYRAVFYVDAVSQGGKS
jgi:hypothetical protein